LNGTTFTLVGMISTGSGFGDNTIIIPLATAQSVYKVSGVSEVTVYAGSDSDVQPLVNRLKSALGSGVDVTAQSDLFQATLTALKDAQGNIFTTLVVAIITAALVILFAVMLIVRERTREIGLLKAIGASNWQVVSQFGVEVLSLSGIAAVVAALLLIITGNTLASKFDITSNTGGFTGGGGRFFGGAIPTSNQAPFSAGLTASTLITVLGLGIALAVLASVIPAWYVARTKPAEVLRAE
ncbi:MAG TPA: FtsX-like permease family protein, partial [Ktedonobacterales bacterium]|nr:FtsX-like permease family protein [Ktedonobacterales bacterium]